MGETPVPQRPCGICDADRAERKPPASELCNAAFEPRAVCCSQPLLAIESYKRERPVLCAGKGVIAHRLRGHPGRNLDPLDLDSGEVLPEHVLHGPDLHRVPRSNQHLQAPSTPTRSQDRACQMKIAIITRAMRNCIAARGQAAGKPARRRP